MSDANDRYEAGYRDGQGNVEADWIFALDEYCTLPDGVEPVPTQVAKYIARLQEEVESGSLRTEHRGG